MPATKADRERARELLRELEAHSGDGLCRCTRCGVVLAEALAEERERVLSSRAMQLVESIAGEFERTVKRAEWEAAGSKGMSVPFFGDFAAATRLPSVISRMRWWSREIRTALADLRTATARTTDGGRDADP